MTAPLPDDELRAMLEARADRASADAERAALAGFRAAVRGASDGRGGFAVIPQALSSRDARLPWGLAVVGLVAVVVVAVLGGRLSTPTDVASTVPPSFGTVAASPAASTISIPPLAADPVAIDGKQLEWLIPTRTLNGQVVVVFGRLVFSPCPYSADSLCPAGLDGLPGVQIRYLERYGTDLESELDQPGTLPLVFRVGANRVLTLLGVADSGVDSPLTIDELSASTTPVGDLAVVKAWLLERRSGDSLVAPCSIPSAPAVRCDPPKDYVLSDAGPDDPGTGRASPTIDAGIVPEAVQGIVANSKPVTFVVRRTEPGWVVEGRYGAVVPAGLTAGPNVTPRPDTQLDAGADELRAMLASGTLAGTVVVVNGRLGGEGFCPDTMNARCPAYIGGLPDVTVMPPEDPALRTAWNAATASGLTPKAFRVEADQTLAFLGTVASGTPVPLSGYGLARLRGTEGQLVLARGRLRELRGTEVFIPCPAPASVGPQQQCLLRSTHLLFDERPAPGGIPGAEVDVAPGVDPAMLTADGSATYLVRWVGGRWQVEGEQSLPTVTIEEPASDAAIMSPDQLRAALADGSVVGRLVLMDGEMQMVQVPCPQPGACTVPVLRELSGVPIAIDPDIAPSLEDAPPSQPLVFFGASFASPDPFGLVYLGTSSEGLRSRLSVPELIALGDPVVGGDVRLVDGWLLEGSVLADTKNESLHGTNADDRLPVVLGDRVARANVVPGPFLVRSGLGSSCDLAPVPSGQLCEGAQVLAWQVVAQVDDRPVIWVGSP